MTEATYNLSCPCGGVRLEVSAELMGPFQCYCRQCRHASGGGAATVAMAPRDAVAIEGNVASYAEPTASGKEATRSFCPTCGTAAYSELGSTPDLIAIKLSMFDDPPWDAIQGVFWTSEAPRWAGINAPSD